ncbi:MAG: ATP synthase F1 subunit gamma [Candidatus Eisenbacteria bacterium]|nr:ATP synthase F1 subunit gamma [Candidatus Eisenbacteria bacterium]
MASIKDIRRRIRSVQSTQQITKAMEMVAAAKLRRAQERSLSARPYAERMSAILASLSGTAAAHAHPLFGSKGDGRRTIVVIASDKGLCGAFNSNLFRFAENEIGGVDRGRTNLICVGKRACDHFGRRQWTGSIRLPELGDQVDLGKAAHLARHLIDLFAQGGTDKVDFIYTRFITTGSRRILQETFLPVASPAEGRAGPREYIFEPSAAAVLGDLLPRYVQTRVFAAMADSIASEHAARLISMSAANKNAGDMITALTQIRNKLRQGAITKELSELVGGAEALK